MNYKKLVAVLIGNTMQFYDFTIYAFLSTQISKEFFNFKDQALSYLVVFCVFAGGYITRPLGAILFGYFGDKRGRSNALSYTIIFSALTTFLIGIIPSYQYLGVISPLLLIIFRLIQGLAVSGEEGGSVVLLFEEYSFKRSGLIGSFVLSSVLVGVLIGMIVCLEVSRMMSAGTVGDWGWRLPFFLSLPLGIIGFSLRLYLNDSKLFSRAKENGLVINRPTKSLFREHSWAIIYGVSIVSLYSVMTSTLIVHLPYFFKTQLNMKNETGLLILIFCLSLIVILTPIFGRIFERSDSVRTHTLYSLIIAASSPLLFLYLTTGNAVYVISATIIFSILVALISSTIFSILVGRFPFGVRYSGVSLSFNLSVTIFSSSTPVLLIFFENYFKTNNVIGYYISLVSLISLFSSNYFQKKIPTANFNDSHIEKSLYNSMQIT